MIGTSTRDLVARGAAEGTWHARANLTSGTGTVATLIDILRIAIEAETPCVPITPATLATLVLLDVLTL